MSGKLMTIYVLYLTYFIINFAAYLSYNLPK